MAYLRRSFQKVTPAFSTRSATHKLTAAIVPEALICHVPAWTVGGLRGGSMSFCGPRLASQRHRALSRQAFRLRFGGAFLVLARRRCPPGLTELCLSDCRLHVGAFAVIVCIAPEASDSPQSCFKRRRVAALFLACDEEPRERATAASAPSRLEPRGSTQYRRMENPRARRAGALGAAPREAGT
jgi:hypothetical protein